MDWDDVFKGILACLLVVAAVLGVRIVTASKTVDYYYLSRGEGGNRTATCVYAHWTWHPDEEALCTDDSNKAIDFMARANAALHNR